MRFTKIFALVLAVFCCFSCVLGCNVQEEDTVTQEENEQLEDSALLLSNVRQDISQYTVIRPDENNNLIDCAVMICKAAEEKTGHYPAITTDYIIDESKFDPDAPEILVGDTGRPESAQAKAQLGEKAPYLITQIKNKICIVAHDNKGVVKGVQEFLSIYFNYVQEGNSVSDYHSVRDYGAVGDGVEDDSLAFKKAIRAAEADGKPVYVPAGTYLVTEVLTLNSVTLYGYESGSWTADATDLPTIYHNNLEEPLFDVCAGSLTGLNLVAQGTSATSIDACETIKVSGVGSHVSNIRIMTPWIGIQATYNNTGRSVIENVFIVQAWKVGVDISGTWDVATLQNIEVWNNDMSHPCPTAFRFGKNDALHAVNLFCFNAGTGFEFYDTPDGGTWASFDNCGVDLTSIGVSVGAGTHHLTFIGGTFWGHHHGLKINSTTGKDTLVTFNGCEIITNGASPIDINGGRMTTVTGCNIVRIASGHGSIPVSINGGSAVTIVGNSISTLHTAVQIASTFKGAANVTGNTILSGAQRESIAISNSASKATVNTDGNVVLLNQTFE